MESLHKMPQELYKAITERMAMQYAAVFETQKAGNSKVNKGIEKIVNRGSKYIP